MYNMQYMKIAAKIISKYLEIKGCEVHHLEQKAKIQHKKEQFGLTAVTQATWRARPLEENRQCLTEERCSALSSSKSGFTWETHLHVKYPLQFHLFHQL